MPPKKKQKLHHVSSSPPSKKPPPLQIDNHKQIWVKKPEEIQKLIYWQNDTFIVASTSISQISDGNRIMTLSKQIEFQHCNFENELFNLVWCPERAELYCFEFEVQKLIVINLNTNTEMEYKIDRCSIMDSEYRTGGYDSVSQKIMLLTTPDDDEGKLTCYLFDTEKKKFDFVDKELPIRGIVSASVVRTKSRQLYVYGELEEESCLWCYDFPTNSWSTVKVTGGTMPKFRVSPAFAIPPGNDQPFALLYGGEARGYGTCSDWWQFHFDTCQWSRIVNHRHIPIMKYPMISFSDQQNALVIDSTRSIEDGLTCSAASITISALPTERKLFDRRFPLAKKMLEDPKFTDVHVMLKDGSVDLHRFVLAMYPSINQMVTTSLTPVGAKSTSLPFLLDLRALDIPLKIFKTYVVEFMYTDNPSRLHYTTDDLVDVVEVSKALGLNNLHYFCFLELDDVLRLHRSSAVKLALSILQHKSAATYINLVKVYFQSVSREKKAEFVEEIIKHQNQLPPEVMIQLLRWSTEEVVPVSPIRHGQPENCDNKLLDNYFDIYLTDRDNSVKVGAHKALLVVTSDYFKSLILGSFQESVQLQSNSIGHNHSSSATTTTSTTTSHGLNSGSLVDDPSNVLALDCSGGTLKVFKAYIYGQPVNVSLLTAEEYLDLLFDLIQLLDQLMIDIGSIMRLNRKQLTADRLFECYDLTQDTEVWKIIANTFDLEDLRLMYSSGSVRFSTAVNHDVQNEDE